MTYGDRNYSKQQKPVEILLFWSQFSNSEKFTIKCVNSNPPFLILVEGKLFGPWFCGVYVNSPIETVTM